MNNSTRAAANFAAQRRRNSSRKISPFAVCGGVSLAGVVLACGLTVYANVFGASVFPTAPSDGIDVAAVKRSTAPAIRSVQPAFDEVFAALSEPAPLISAPVSLPAGPSLDFTDRFAAAAPQGAPSRAAEAKPETPPAPNRQVAELAPLPLPAPKPAALRSTQTARERVRDITQGAKAAVLAAVAEKPTIFEKLFGSLKTSSASLAFASADASVTGSLGPTQNPALGGSAPYDRSTAVYDISAHMVYMPDGTKLEAHSGLGARLDDPKYVHVKMQGATPPHVYDLEPREALFHGVPALRLKPIGGEEAIYGRAGLLAHTYMLGPNGDSNGCVSFKDYNAFLQAYRDGKIKRLAVVAKVD
jgi:type VI secretion system (T6SS) effector TldE1-like protein